MKVSYRPVALEKMELHRGHECSGLCGAETRPRGCFSGLRSARKIKAIWADERLEHWQMGMGAGIATVGRLFSPEL